MTLRANSALGLIALASLFVGVAGCGAESHARDPDASGVDGSDAGTVDADHARPDSGAIVDAGGSARVDAGPLPPGLCGGHECALSEACCTASGTCFDPTDPGGCVVTAPPPPETGGGTPCASNDDCGLSQFCRVAEGSCIGPGWCFERNDPGISCPEGAAPACACDGRSYASLCEAYAAGVSVSRAGMGTACGSSGPSGVVACGHDADCSAGESCCARTNLCVDPACVACCAAPPPGTELGCRDDRDCRSLGDRSGSDYFCFGSGCGGASGGDTSGGCVRAVSTACSGALVPVCGCDGLAYANACWAQAAHTRIAHAGMCP